MIGCHVSVGWLLSVYGWLLFYLSVIGCYARLCNLLLCDLSLCVYDWFLSVCRLSLCVCDKLLRVICSCF